MLKNILLVIVNMLCIICGSAQAMEGQFFPATSRSTTIAAGGPTTHDQSTCEACFSEFPLVVQEVQEQVSDNALPEEQYPLVTDAFQSEAVFTCSDDSKPIVATYGCGPCVALGGYDCVNKAAFMVHFATSAEVRVCFQKIIDHIRLFATKKLTPENPIMLHLRGGVEGMSEQMIQEIKTRIYTYPDLPMMIGSEKVLFQRFGPRKSLAIDSRSGKTYQYDHTLNQSGRKSLDMNICVLHALLSALSPNITIAYVAPN